MKILVVDDARTTLAYLSAYVERQGSVALTADSGHQAVEVFEAQRPDLVLLDVMLPDIDGYEVARRIRQAENPGDWTPIIFLSAMTGDQDLVRGIAAGGDDYLYKPISEVVLNAKLQAMQRIIQMRTSLVVLTRKLDNANQELQRLSSSDGLTGIPNRRYFDQALAREWRRARRNGSEIALILGDVDMFKAYNDAYGHQAGDDCLRQVASTLVACLDRGGDLAARYGGEEFVVILPDTSQGGALFVAERVRQGVRALGQPHLASPFGQVTLSLGVACLVPDENTSEQTLIEAADRALYRAKEQGRDRVCRFDPAFDPFFEPLAH